MRDGICVSSQYLLPPLPRGLGVQIPPPGPESWPVRLHPKANAEAAAKYARGDDGRGADPWRLWRDE